MFYEPFFAEEWHAERLAVLFKITQQTNARIKTGLWDFWSPNTQFYVLCSMHYNVGPKVIYSSRPTSNAPSLTRPSSVPWEGFANLSAMVSLTDLLRWTEFHCVLCLVIYISGSFTKLWGFPGHNCHESHSMTSCNLKDHLSALQRIDRKTINLSVRTNYLCCSHKQPLQSQWLSETKVCFFLI